MILIKKHAGMGNAAGGGGDADGWFTPGRFALILAALIAVCFFRPLLGLETFFYRDFGAFAYPLAFYHREAFWRGELPLWNPYNFCGMPFLAQWNTLTLYPVSLFYLLFPLSWSLGVFNLLHMFWAGLGMYLLARRWTGNSLAASVAGLVFAFNGLSWCSLMWSNNIAALGWMPWLVLWAERAWREGGARNIVVTALVGAMQMLTGAPEVIILTWFVLGVLWAVEWLSTKEARGRMVWRMLPVGGLVASLAAAQLVPFIELLLHSQRDTTFGSSEWSMPPSGWANYLVPLFHCARGPQGVYYQYFQGWTSSYYMGIGTIFLALVAAWRVRGRRTWILAGFAIFSASMALGDGGHVYTVVRKIFPLMGFMRFPIKFVILGTFALPLLAATTVAWWQGLTAGQRELESRRLWQVGGLLLGVVTFLVWWEWLIQRPEKCDPMTTTINALLRLMFLALVLGCLTLFHRAKGVWPQRLMRIALLLFFWFDVFTHAPDLNPTVKPYVFEPDLIRQFRVSQKDNKWDDLLKVGETRAMPEWATIAKVMFRAVDVPDSDVIGRRMAVWCDFNLLDHVPKFDGFFSLSLREMEQIDFYSATSTTNDSLPKLKDFLGVSQINSTTNPVDWVERDSFMPLITAGQQPLFAADEAALQTVTSPGFEPAQFVYLPLETRPFITATNRARAQILSKHFEAQHVTAEVEAAAPAMVVVAQAYYHLWRAYVDGKPVPLCRANYAFQAVEVPAGRHQISLVYEDQGFFYGSIVSLGSLAGCLVVWFRCRRNGAGVNQPKD